MFIVEIAITFSTILMCVCANVCERERVNACLCHSFTTRSHQIIKNKNDIL